MACGMLLLLQRHNTLSVQICCDAIGMLLTGDTNTVNAKHLYQVTYGTQKSSGIYNSSLSSVEQKTDISVV